MKSKSKSFVELAQLMMDRKISFQPWQEGMIELICSRKPFYYRGIPKDGMEVFRLNLQLLSLRENWKAGKSTVMFSPHWCSLSKPKVIFDEFIFIDG